MHFNKICGYDRRFLPIQDRYLNLAHPKTRPDNITKLTLYLLPLFDYTYSTKSPVLMRQ